MICRTKFLSLFMVGLLLSACGIADSGTGAPAVVSTSVPASTETLPTATAPVVQAATSATTTIALPLAITQGSDDTGGGDDDTGGGDDDTGGGDDDTGGDGATDVLETFEDTAGSWKVSSDTANGGSISQVTSPIAAGKGAAKLTTARQGGKAQIRTDFSDSGHSWEERPGTWHWQRASVYLPAASLSKLGSSDYFDLAGFSDASGTKGWTLRVRQNGELYVYGLDEGGKAHEFRAYGKVPSDHWFTLEIGLHSQDGPGVKRAFAFIVDGDVYGWYRQGYMSLAYSRAAIGIVQASSAAALDVYLDEWGIAGDTQWPTGKDNRSTAAVQEQDFRSGSGVQVQYDWSTWQYTPILDSTGVYVASGRLQAGRNIDRMPSLKNGWAEIEIAWPKGQPPFPSSIYFGPMVGFHKEINREENLEIIPYLGDDGKLYLVFEAWTGTGVTLARWPLPGNAVPGNGDIIRVRWEEKDTTQLNVQVSYYDASASRWYTPSDVIQGDFKVSSIPDNDAGKVAINYLDTYHTASSITIDSEYYAISRFQVGTLDSYPK